MANKVDHLVSKVPGWTVGTKTGNSAFLDPGEAIPASEVVDSVVENVRAGGVYSQFASIEQREQPSVLDPRATPVQDGAGATTGARTGSGGRQGRRSGSRSRGGEFNPEEHNVDDVLAHLKDASPDEVERVKNLEAASERKSVQVAEFEPSSS